jgi:hypothetical protein
MRSLLGFGLVALGLVVVAGLGARAADEKPKYTISEVMVKAHKEGLLKKVTSGKASDAEKKQLCEMYEALAANKPPKGDASSWKDKTSAIVAACKKDDAKALAKATNCGACHSVHK